jgi:hypothetical protein
MLAEIFWNQDTLAIVMIFGLPVMIVVAVLWHRTECHRSDNELKRSMVERGFTADEIERVIAVAPERKTAPQKAVT